MALIPPKINSNLYTFDLSWLQEGYTYGVNDSGPWQKFKRRGFNNSIEEWYNTLYNAGWIVTVTREKVDSPTSFGISTIEASCGWPFPFVYGQETTENIFELDPQDEQKALLEADFPNGNLNLTAKSSREAVAKLVQDPGAAWYPPGSPLNKSVYGIAQTGTTSYVFDDGQLPILQGDPVVTGSDAEGYTVTYPVPVFSFVRLPSADYAIAYSLYLMLKAGIENYPMEASIIRHMILTSNLYAIQASFLNVDRIISSASMGPIEGVPGDLLFTVPTKPTPQQFIETPGDLQYGWRKVRPHVSRLSRMKNRITQNYILGLYPVKIFGAVL